MKPDPRAQSLAYLWLYSAGVDPANLDTSGVPLAESLAVLLTKEWHGGRKEAAGHYLRTVEEGDDEVTGRYPALQLKDLRK